MAMLSYAQNVERFVIAQAPMQIAVETHTLFDPWHLHSQVPKALDLCDNPNVATAFPDPAFLVSQSASHPIAN